MIHEPVLLRKAALNDARRIWQILLQAKERMRLAGSRQWQDGYPAFENVVSDIDKGYGYVFCLDGLVVAFAAVIFDDDPAYLSIDGQWLTGNDADYVLVHRLAVADEMKRRGIATLFMQQVEKLGCERNVASFRIDTNYDNRYMQAIMSRLEFAYCGIVKHRGNARMAYEKIISDKK